MNFTKQLKNLDSSSFLPILCASIGHILWGFSYLFTKTALQTASSNVLLSYRFLFATLVMTLLILSGNVRVSYKGKNWKIALLLAALQLLYYSFETYSIQYTNATISGAVLAVSPIIAIVFALIFLKEYPTRRQAIFSILPVLGVVIMTVAGSSLGIIQSKGVFFLAMTCIISGAYKTVNRKTSEDFSSFERTYLVLTASAIGFTISAFKEVGGDLGMYLAPLSVPSFIIAVVILGVFCSIGANLLVNYAVGKMAVVKLSSFGAITTLCSMFAGVIFLGEPMTPSLLIGAFMILVGIYQVTKP
ncbi:MAG: DMT family transporter [Lachnospiraceae bacterium]|nr:DMT family transporter [Lachnospiraceae bacterium]